MSTSEPQAGSSPGPQFTIPYTVYLDELCLIQQPVRQQSAGGLFLHDPWSESDKVLFIPGSVSRLVILRMT